MKVCHLVMSSLIAFISSNLFCSTSSCCPSTENCSSAEQFAGFDISAGVGYGGIVLHTTRGGIKPLSHTKYGGDGVAVQLKGGWDWAVYKMGLIGIEAYGQWNSAQTKNDFFETATSTIMTVRKFRMEWNLGLDARLGLAPFSSNLVFIYGGPDWGHYHFYYKNVGVEDTFNKFKLGGVFGAGLEQLISDHWTLKATFDYRWYPSETISYVNGEVQTIKPRLGTALFMLGYIF